MKKIITMDCIVSHLTDMFPSQKINKNSVTPFSTVDFSINNEAIHKDFCIPFKLENSSVQYVWDVISNVIFANLQDFHSEIMNLESKQQISDKTYRVFNAKGQFGLEIKDCPKIKNKADALKVWHKICKKYEAEFKGHFYPEFVKALVSGHEGYLVAMKNVGDGYRDILFIRAEDGADVRIGHAARFVHFTYLETPAKIMVDVPYGIINK